MTVLFLEAWIELRADLIVKERDVLRRMRLTTDPHELRRLRDYRIDLYDAIHGWEMAVPTAYPTR